MCFAIVRHGCKLTAAATLKTNTTDVYRKQFNFSPCPSAFMSVYTRTYFGHFRHRRLVGSVQKPRLVVVDVLDLDDELGLGLQRPVCQAVTGLGTEDILGFHLPVQPLNGMDVPRAVVNGEGGARALTRQDVLYGAVPFIHV